MRNLEKRKHSLPTPQGQNRKALPDLSVGGAEKDEKALSPAQRQFAEAYARAKRRLTGAEWAQRFKVTRRTITNWLRYPQVQAVIQACKRGNDVAIDRDFVEKLSADERHELSELLEQQERIENEPGGEFTFEELKDIIIAKAFRTDEREVVKVLDFLEGMTEVFRALLKARPHAEQPFASTS